MMPARRNLLLSSYFRDAKSHWWIFNFFRPVFKPIFLLPDEHPAYPVKDQSTAARVMGRAGVRKDRFAPGAPLVLPGLPMC